MENLIYSGPGERIDSYLAQKFPYSRSFFHHIIKRGGIEIKHKNEKIKKSYKLRDGDEILIDNLERYLDGEVLDEAPNIDIPVIKETDDYLIIHKPKGVLSHPNSIWDAAKPSVVGFLYHRYKNLPSIGNFVRAGLIHRLDKDTDGLMILVKTEKGLAHFKKLFQAKSESDTIEEKEKVPLKKFYRARCYVSTMGKQFLDEIEKQLPYILEEEVVPKVTPCVAKMGISKILHIQYGIENFPEDVVEVELEILTGRTHQIRYHLSNHGLPIVGDILYGADNIKNTGYEMQLTAFKLFFQDPDGEYITLHI